MNFEEDIKRVEEIAAALSSSTTALEEAIDLFEEGMKIAKALEKRLTEAKRTVETVLGEEADSAEIIPLEE